MNYAFGYLFDENFPPLVISALHEERPDLPIFSVGDAGAPPRGTKDPAILVWCEEHDCVLVTNNRTSMPGHLDDHIAEGRSVEGIFHVSRGMPTRAVVANLILVAELSFPGEYRNSVRYLPLQ